MVRYFFELQILQDSMLIITNVCILIGAIIGLFKYKGWKKEILYEKKIEKVEKIIILLYEISELFRKNEKIIMLDIEDIDSIRKEINNLYSNHLFIEKKIKLIEISVNLYFDNDAVKKDISDLNSIFDSEVRVFSNFLYKDVQSGKYNRENILKFYKDTEKKYEEIKHHITTELYKKI